MAKGNSGRIVIEIDPELKSELYSILAREGKTLKEWFILQANSYLQNNSQLSFEFQKDSKSDFFRFRNRAT